MTSMTSMISMISTISTISTISMPSTTPTRDRSARPSSAIVLGSALLAAAVSAPLAADEVAYDCVVNAKTSTLSQTTTVTAPFAGTLKGDYDATTNPTGTQTRPGVFGGSGNVPIPYTAAFAIDGEIATNPTGAAQLGVDVEGLVVRVSGFELDFLAGGTAELPATVNITYSTFRTFAPNSLYPGASNVPVPVGNAEITAFTAVQTGTGVFGALAPQKDGSFLFTAAVPVEYTIEASALGQPVGDGAPLAGVLPISGTLVVGEEGITVTFDIEGGDSVEQPLELDPFVDQPLALPTVLPPGATANLLLSGDVTSVAFASTLLATIVIDGVPAQVAGDVNGDGVVDAFDLAALLSAWGTTGGAADLNGDGPVDASDLAILLANWTF